VCLLFRQTLNFDRANIYARARMPRSEYRSLTIPEGLYQDLEKFVELSNGSYVSISEVVREAIRGYLRKNTAET
jgi:hypothetical protein